MKVGTLVLSKIYQLMSINYRRAHNVCVLGYGNVLMDIDWTRRMFDISGCHFAFIHDGKQVKIVKYSVKYVHEYVYVKVVSDVYSRKTFT